MIKSRINGRRVFSLGVILTILCAAIFWQVNVKEGQAQSGGGFKTAAFQVDGFSQADLTSAVSGTPVPIYAEGRIFTLDGSEEVGVWRVWGVKRLAQDLNGTPSAIAVVNINFELDGFNGVLTAQGTLKKTITDALNGDDIVTITGGAGTFRGANGEAGIQTKNDGTVIVRLQEAKRR